MENEKLANHLYAVHMLKYKVTIVTRGRSFAPTFYVRPICSLDRIVSSLTRIKLLMLPRVCSAAHLAKERRWDACCLHPYSFATHIHPILEEL